MNDPQAATLLRGAQIEFQYILNKHLNENGLTVDEVAETAGISVVIVRRMAAGTYTGLLSYLFAVALAIGKVPIFDYEPVSPAPGESASV